MFRLKLSKRLITTTVLMALILVLIIVVVIKLFSEKDKIQLALDLSQQNREQLLKSEKVTESLLLVDGLFKEYCATFHAPVFVEYKAQIKNLSENIRLLKQAVVEESSEEDQQLNKIFDEKSSESVIYVKLRQITDSLIFSAEVLEENQVEIREYYGQKSVGKIDTLSVTETKTEYKKGLLGKIKSAIVGEKVEQNVNTKMLVQSSSGTDVPYNMQTERRLSPRTKSGELAQKAFELRESELKLIEINNRLIAEIRGLTDEIINGIKIQEAEQNKTFLNSVEHSTKFLQNVLIILMLIACALAGYILLLAYRNEKFQENIISLNKKVTRDSVEKDKFFSVLSHDLLNPFNALLGFSEMLNEAVANDDKEDTKEYSSIVQQSAKRIYNLLQNLLVWGRMQNGKTKYSPSSVEIEELVSGTIMVVSPIARNKEIRLEWEVRDKMVATVDANMLSSVLQNLITNAIKFTHRQGNVVVKSFEEAGQLNFVVSDTGVGMSQEQIDNLFKLDKTTSTKGTDDESGTGLGLIISKEFIEKHRGKIWVTSTPGKGSNFCFSIPL